MASAPNHHDPQAVVAHRLSENAPVFVQRTEGGDPARHNGLLIGNIKDQFLVIGAFTTATFRAGEPIVMRLIIGNHLIGFPTQIAKVIDDPPLYLVRFPIQVESLNLRKSQRIQAFFPAEVQVSKPAGGSTDVYLLKTRVLDISAGGCSFGAKTPLTKDAEVRIAFSLPGDRHVQSIAATVIECSHSSGVFHIRVRFNQDAANLVALQEIGKWVVESASYTA